MDLGVEAYEQGGVTVIVLAGDIDSRTVPNMESQLVPLVEDQPRVCLDMRAVTYLSSAGLRLLLILYRQITGRGGRVVLAGLPPMISDTMQNTGFMDFFEAYDTVAEGLQVLQTAL